MSVTVIDPNKVTTNNLVNGIPKYEDMSIYVKLSATSRDRSVIIVNDNGSVNTTESVNASAKGVNLNNFIKFNSNLNGDNSFKTNWVQNGVSNQDDAFGISEIKIVTNSSYIPQVNIKFIDVRGAAFFNNANSPYRLLFDFPPPIFELTVKGYYGQGIKYKLHLTKYTTEFQADSGNYVIDAQFVAVTFAPLADIPLRYITQFAYINNGIENVVNDTDSKKAPKTTNELIIKARNAYAEINKEIGNSTNKNTFDIINSNREQLIQCVDYINSMVSSDTTPLIKGGVPKFYIADIDLVNSNKNTEDTTGFNIKNLQIQVVEESDIPNTSLSDDGNLVLTTINKISEYQNLINRDKTKNWGLFIGYEPVDYNNGIVDNINNKLQEKSINDFIVEFNAKMKGFGINVGSTYRKISYGGNTIVNPKRVYYTIDITNVSKTVLKQFGDNDVNSSKVKDELNSEINQIIQEKLGMLPSISNIFSIILNDVDHFFDTLRQTSKLADEHHEKFKSLILPDNQYADTGSIGQTNTNNKVYAFPLVIDKFQKVSPVKLAKSLNIPKFPEVDLVDRFIKSFDEYRKEQEAVNMKNEMSETGNKKWIPFTPLDSSNFGISDNPYLKVGSSNTGVKTNSFNNIMEIALNRYYILKQYCYFGTFDKDAKKIKPFDELFGKAEAINIYNTIYGNSLIKNQINIQSNKYKGNIDSLYTDIFTTNYNFPIDTVDNLPLSYDYPVYINKEELNKPTENITIITSLPTPRVDSTTDNDLINKFIKEANEDIWGFSLPFSSSDNNSLGYYKYSTDNLIYIDDNDDNKLKTKFITTNNLVNKTTSDYIVENKYGNHQLYDLNLIDHRKASKKLNIFGDIENAWLYLYNDYRNYINEGQNPNIKTLQNIFSKNDFELSENYKLVQHLLILSNFGRTASPFNIVPNYLNEHVFNVPSLIVTPVFLPLYLGVISKIANDKTIYDYVVNFFKTGDGSAFYNDMILIFADINDTIDFLSPNDKLIFEKYYNDRNTTTKWFDNILTKISEVYSNLDKNYLTSTDTVDLFKKILTDSNIYDIVMEKVTLINNTSLTFYMESLKPAPKFYTSLASENVDATNKENNQRYFEILLNELNTLTQPANSSITKKSDEDSLTSTNDPDIINETYYSFKNINDKWLAGNENTGGYPFIGGSGKLFDQFVFVDRTMKNIGDDTMINPETLVNIFDNDTDISVYSALSQLLSLNGFEFFPLQNFITLGETKAWSDKVFKINIDNNCITTSPTFVCMYVGGASSYPTTGDVKDQFLNDGITTFDIDSANDFQESSDIKAFKVKFGEQAQSHFVDIKIDSKEHPETNESIQILARLAGDEKQRSAIPKGQNLYNLYENRSYKATITGLGNVMFQPTQYFQLENVPMYNGAYIILSVEHTITPNKMVTSFSGTKILKYPKPRVTSPSTTFNIGIGTSSATSNDDYVSPPIKKLPEDTNITENATNSNDIPLMMRNNALYTYGNADNEFIYGGNYGKLTLNGGTYIDRNFGSSSSTSMVSGKFNYVLPRSNVNDPSTIYKSNNPNLQTNGQWKDLLKKSIDKYAKMYDTDANVIAAQIYGESGFKLWAYSPTGAIGVTQFIPSTLHNIAITNNGSGEKFTQSEIDKLHHNIPYGKTPKEDIGIFSSREFRMQVFQNAMDNPDLMIKAQCRYMKQIANKSNNLLSTTLFAYNRGTSFAKKNYLDAYYAAKKYNGGVGWEKEGVSYVYTIWKRLSTEFGSGYATKLNLGAYATSFNYDQAVKDSLNVKPIT